MRWLSLFLACHHLNPGTNFREWEDQSWLKFQVVPVFNFDWCKMFWRAFGVTLTPGWRPFGVTAEDNAAPWLLISLSSQVDSGVQSTHLLHSYQQARSRYRMISKLQETVECCMLNVECWMLNVECWMCFLLSLKHIRIWKRIFTSPASSR
jgi:hypothetical protein